MGPVRTTLVATCVFLGSAAAASAETITVPHSSGGTIDRDENGYKADTFVPKDKVTEAPEPKVGKGQRIRKAMTAGAFLPGAQVVGKQVGKKVAIAGAASFAGPALGLAIVIGGTAYTGYEAYRWFKGPSE